jgi:hypothetical protein
LSSWERLEWSADTPFAARSRTLAVASATAIARRKLGISHPKLTEVQDFADCPAAHSIMAGSLMLQRRPNTFAQTNLLHSG